jgi:tRNA-specific adenosine deaminase 1
MKCLPATKLCQARGNVLHDWHAEVVAMRAFNRFLLDELRLQSKPPYAPSPFIQLREPSERTEAEHQPFAIKDGVEIHMYCSEAPCGDASMELVMNAQEDATPWTTAPATIRSATDLQEEPSEGLASDLGALRGRSNFDHLGAVRLKPSRPDAPPTLSKSCTDKLALKQCTSLLSSVTSMLISPRNAYLSSLVLPRSQCIGTACFRAFGPQGRMKAICPTMAERWDKSGYRYQSFEVTTTEREFDFSRRGVSASQKAVPSNLTAVYTPHLQETLIGGTLQGRKQFDSRGASAICRRSMWKIAVEVAAWACVPTLAGLLRKSTYKEVKQLPALKERNAIKEHVQSIALAGWVKSDEDLDFSIESQS